MLRLTLALGLAAALLATSSTSHAEATLKILQSPVVAGEVVRIRVHIDEPLKAPLRGAAGIGAVGPFTQTAPKTYEADYSPPKGCGPALSEIVVYEDRIGGVLAYALANIDDMVKTSVKLKNREPIYVRAGADRKGPFHADSHGEFALLFAANGELRSADLESAQGKVVGNVTVKPTMAKTVAIARPSKLHAGDKRDGEVLLILPYDRTVKIDPPRATATAGSVALDLKGSWDVALRYALTPPAQMSGPVSVKLVDALGRVLGNVAFQPAGPPIGSIAMRLPTKPLGAGEHAVLDLTVLDKSGNGVDGELQLDVDQGKLSTPLPLGGGIYNVTFTAPAQVPEGGEVHLTAKVFDSDASANGAIKIHGGKAAKVVFHKLADQVARAGETVTVEGQVLDEGGNPADPDDLQIAADHGEVTGVKSQDNGRFEVAIRAEADASDLMLTARDGNSSLEGENHVTLEPASDMPLAILGPEAGFGNNFGHVSAANITVSAQFLVGPHAASMSTTAGFIVGYLPVVTETLTSDQSTSGTLQLSRVPVMARIGGFYELGDLGFFGGLGAGVERLSGSLTSVGRTPLTLDSWRPAAGLYGGAGYKLGPGFISVELRATYASVDIQSPEVRVSGPVGGIDGALGYLFTL